jgi:hypothetical protein
MKKVTFNKKEPLLTNKFVICTGETSEVLYVEHSFERCWNLDTQESRSEIPGKIPLPESDGVHQLDRACDKWCIAQSQGGKEYLTYNIKK